MKLPKLKYWYHATSIEKAHEIVWAGYIKPSFDGIYFANSSQYAGGFMRMRGLEEWVTFKIPRDRLDAKQLFLGQDHNPSFYPKDLVVAQYDGGIVFVNEEDCLVYEAAE